jgi:hypothetical protein
MRQRIQLPERDEYSRIVAGFQLIWSKLADASPTVKDGDLETSAVT